MRDSSSIPLIKRARDRGARPAILADDGQMDYRSLLDASSRIAARLLDGDDDLGERRVALLAPPGTHYVAAQWGVWRAGGIVVPLGIDHPPAELHHVLRDSGASRALVHPEWKHRLPGDVPRICTEESLEHAPADRLPQIEIDRRAMIVYTSGTTGRPKGVVTTHANLDAQIRALVEAWEWTADDHILLVLPLHHVHGIVNVVGCCLASGARCTMLRAFDAARTWSAISRGDLTLLMAVPTIYAKLASEWETAGEADRRDLTAASRRMRLQVSGSAALPRRLFERWEEIGGHRLLERYGMTEIGMALSNPLRGERRPGHVGNPLPGVEMRLIDDDGNDAPVGSPGELLVRGPSVFLEYWGRQEETAAAFRDGWFRTGDIAVMEDGSHRLLGRKGMDIIKTGGYKVSALEIEDVLREDPAVADCAVVGVPDEEWGERVAAAVQPADGGEISIEDLLERARTRLAPYKAPRLLRIVEALPRNAMGKVTKQEVRRWFSDTEGEES